MRTDWSYLSYWLATAGIPSDVAEDVADNPADDPWTPADGEEIVVVRITKEDASTLASWVADRAKPMTALGEEA